MKSNKNDLTLNNTKASKNIKVPFVGQFRQRIQNQQNHCGIGPYTILMKSINKIGEMETIPPTIIPTSIRCRIVL